MENARKPINEQLIHIRRYDEKGKLLSTGGATIIIAKSDRPRKFHMHVAQCCDKDVFCRRIGRSIVTGRLKKRPGLSYDRMEVKTLLDYYTERYTGKLPEWYPSILEEHAPL